MHLQHWLHYNKKIDDYENINSVNPLHVIISKSDGYIEEKNGSKYLTFASTDENKEVLEKYTKLCNEIENFIKKINNKPGEYEKDFMNIRFESDDNLP